ncbi:anaphase-promoting complex subunit Cut9 [Coemansia spiralis]|uniref:Anaphase-promoting complex subunit Cut9 n=2 Tax=Coemansia TaxID=4863 RepID=A0A9W8G2C6_9FUNG|nr:anaphase-promoting complex subunit Cut9 [Coemansia umbellata]KAJ2619335.1 anaphase-promoting complex subunit Cut9 [Coemansia sp. RSA 1358]KAJ2670719.1 anaphase-promoting complex subunit Cut9 [Coemansia spiralis]
MSDIHNRTLEVVTHLRSLRTSCAKGMAWCSALIWAEKAFLLSEDTDDLLWLIDALVTNGQFRQAEEWLLNPLYGAKCRASSHGRYLASVVAMRLGRAEEALELLAVDSSRHTRMSASSEFTEGSRAEKTPMLETPVAARKMAGGTSTASTESLVSSISLADQRSGVSGGNMLQGVDTSSGSQSLLESLNQSNTAPLNPRAWMMYMQGAAVIQLANIGGNEDTPGIKSLSLRYPEARLGLWPGDSASGLPPPMPNISKTPMPHTKQVQIARLGMIDSLVARLWIETLRVDPRCWEAWSGIHEYGLLTSEEECRLISCLDWSSSSGGSQAVAGFFKDYCLATRTSFSLGKATVEATERLLSAYPQLMKDPVLQTIQAARLLALGCARESLEYTVAVLEHRRVPDPSATAIHITALTMLHSKEALFRIAHELAEEFGISSIKRAEIEPSDTSSILAPISISGSAGGGASISTTTPRGSSIGAAVAGTGRVRTGARGLLIPETPSKIGSVSGLNDNIAGAGSIRRAGNSASGIASAVAQSASSAATAAWRGLWGLPTWTHPGPPVMATYPCALGPAQSSAVSTEMSMSTLGTFTTTNAQSVGSPTQYEFIGASLAWYAIGCYYLVSATLMVSPGVSQQEWPLAGMLYGNGFAAPTSRHMGVGDAASAATLRRNAPLSAEAEHALAEARRWLAKTTLASPRSIVAWVAFAHTFIISSEWESATRALHTAVGLCGCEGIIHGGGRDSAPSALPPQTPSKKAKQADNTLFPNSNATNKNGGYQAEDTDVERGSLLAYVPLASLGGVYLQMGDLGMAESCFDASACCLSGRHIADCINAWRSVLDSLDNSNILEWSADKERIDAVAALGIQPASQLDSQLLNDVGVMYYSNGDFEKARMSFIIALATLHTNNHMQRSLHTAFSLSSTRNANRRLSPELKAYSALISANLGNTLRKLGDFKAALLCLQAAAEHAPCNMGILLSMAFTLHQRAIQNYNASSSDSNADLDKAIDIYHRILADQPGDPVTTDLLSLALELSINIQDIPSLDGILGIDGALTSKPELFELKDPVEIGLFNGMDDASADNGNTTDDAGYQHADHNKHINQSSQAADERQTLSQLTASSADEDSDEVMDIEEDSDNGDSSESDSDMAMD